MKIRFLLIALIATTTMLCAACSEPESTEPRVALGARHTCALSADGTAYCWGTNTTGQLGDGSTTDRFTPAPVTGDLRFVQLTAGTYHTCGIEESGEAYCWGWNDRGQLGDGTDSTRRTVPTRVAGDFLFGDISAGVRHTCGLTRGRRVYCWGDNEYGQLGDGSRPRRDSTWAEQRSPRATTGALTFIQVTVGAFHSCAVAPNATLYCWGSNGSGQLGNGSFGGKTNRPGLVEDAVAFVDATAGTIHTCAISLLGQIYCWGNDGHGQLGSIGRAKTRPAAVDSLTRYRTIRAMGNRTCAITGRGHLWCWGHNPDGALAVPEPDSLPERIPLPSPVFAGEVLFSSLGSGLSDHICGYTREDQLMCWGKNEYGQIDGSGETRTRPILIQLGTE